jgi:hypothetical protein
MTPMRPIIKEMINNSGGAFSGFGRHLVNDFLFNAEIHPGTLAIYIFGDNETFAELSKSIPEYLEHFTQVHSATVLQDYGIKQCFRQRESIQIQQGL